ncbi:uncharacterized protein K452DRAFT_138685 [Aplosporella prunicola CBS 121167]|uniref:Ecp2 effector protein domain-containing protein n=1 Tax=Aplosporella prunicola CBS 121167 TaxID=1176127 RepID=A0A6A6AYK8_9PEZI|nr:uncharacterized protein K452DRAFT_138685 [Aplosporella prunicola CBS 121167]KAF2136273.1 hypothetical protein K452DRAFT_138685 [Aplosporella prunicola CBS 121167]
MPSLSKTLALLLAATFAVASPAPDFDSSGFEYGAHCEASGGSPKTKDVTDAINKLRGDGGNCRIGNGGKSHCSTYKSSGTASISICGELDDGVACKKAAEYANDVQQLCVQQGHTDLVGGTFWVNKNVKVIVAHS